MARDLAFELAGAPAGIAEREQVFLGTLMAADVAQDVLGRGHRYAAVEGQGFAAAKLAAMDDETAARLGRAAEKDADIVLDRAVLRVLIRLAAGLGEQAGDRPLGQRVIDDNAEGAFVVMAQQQDYGVVETRV